MKACVVGDKGVEIKAAEIMALKREGDHLANLIWRRYVDRLARGLATIVNALDPDVFVMGGGMSNVDEIYDDLPPALAAWQRTVEAHAAVAAVLAPWRAATDNWLAGRLQAG